MAKKTVKAVTRKQKYLAAIAGDGVAPSPITSDEKLMYNIAEKVNEGGDSGGGSTGGGVLVVHASATTEGGITTVTLDTTYADIAAAGFCVLEYVNGHGLHEIKPFGGYGSFGNEYVVIFDSDEYLTDSENGYPAYTYADESQESH